MTFTKFLFQHGEVFLADVCRCDSVSLLIKKQSRFGTNSFACARDEYSRFIVHPNALGGAT
ncbi:hypothetical protein D9M73_276520 [compost metagenome]